jgi:hypothetical protein
MPAHGRQGQTDGGLLIPEEVNWSLSLAFVMALWLVMRFEVEVANLRIAQNLARMTCLDGSDSFL